MFGTIARMHVKPGKLEELRAVNKEFIQGRTPAGFVSTIVYQGKDDPNEVWLAVVFESEKAYYDNASDPSTNTYYEKYNALLDAAPEWHDGQVLEMQEPVRA